MIDSLKNWDLFGVIIIIFGIILMVISINEFVDDYNRDYSHPIEEPCYDKYDNIIEGVTCIDDSTREEVLLSYLPLFAFSFFGIDIGIILIYYLKKYGEYFR